MSADMDFEVGDEVASGRVLRALTPAIREGVAESLSSGCWAITPFSELAWCCWTVWHRSRICLPSLNVGSVASRNSALTWNQMAAKPVKRSMSGG
ncbi:MAG: hypothetical protein JNL67_20895 [Planctomycetaceae bacterium]|nr:hypothetical protein [Planctomycetaceae bacterium]